MKICKKYVFYLKAEMCFDSEVCYLTILYFIVLFRPLHEKGVMSGKLSFLLLVKSEKLLSIFIEYYHTSASIYVGFPLSSKFGISLLVLHNLILIWSPFEGSIWTLKKATTPKNRKFHHFKGFWNMLSAILCLKGEENDCTMSLKAFWAV